jgi:hypothetical protein
MGVRLLRLTCRAAHRRAQPEMVAWARPAGNKSANRCVRMARLAGMASATRCDQSLWWEGILDAQKLGDSFWIAGGPVGLRGSIRGIRDTATPGMDTPNLPTTGTATGPSIMDPPTHTSVSTARYNLEPVSGLIVSSARPAIRRVDCILERGVEFSLLADAVEDSGPTLVELAQISQPLVKRTQLGVIERPGRLLPVWATKGAVAPPSSNEMAAATCCSRTPSSSAMRRLISFIDPERLAGGQGNHPSGRSNLPYENRSKPMSG